jgi:LuxR family transcriptional regulator, maltose regulon positive regulatory protein
VSLDQTDDDPPGFWRNVALALIPVLDQQASQVLRPVALGRVDAAQMPGPLVVALRLVRRSIVLVLDNLHKIHSATIHSGLLRLISRPPPNLSVVGTAIRRGHWRTFASPGC